MEVISMKTNQPRVSVIIPVYNGEKTIGRCLESVSKQDYGNYEIIVADDGSTDHTGDVAKKFSRVRILRQKNRGPASARNLGSRKANGEILLFTDADCVPDRKWIVEMVKPFSKSEIVGVQGRYRSRQKSLVARFIQMEIDDRYERMEKSRNIDFIGTYSAGYRKKIFLSNGGFDESFPSASGEDPALSFKLSLKGFGMSFNPNAVVFHFHHESLGKYLRQKFWRAYWRVLLYKKYPGKMKNESYTPQSLKFQILMFYFALIFSVFSPVLPSASYLAVASLILLFLSSMRLSAKNFRKSKSVGLASPFIIFLRSVSFGIGLLYGLLRLRL